MRFSRSFRLACFGIVTAATTIVCSSGYITPGSLAETEAAEEAISASATALYGLLAPTGGELQLATVTQAAPTLEEPELPTVSPTPTPEQSPTEGAPFVYTAQSGDTLAALSVRFGVSSDEIASPQDISDSFIPAGQIFTIPNRVGVTSPTIHLLPDSEVIYSPTAIDFNTASYVGRMAGHLSNYREYLPSDWYDGAAVVERVAHEHSISPRLLLAVLQEESNWVLGEPGAGTSEEYPLGHVDPKQKGLYHQLSWAARVLSSGYYGWRDARLTTLTFPDGQELRLAPDLNAGTVAIQYFFSQLYNYDEWLDKINPDFGFAFTYGDAMFPDPWLRARDVEPLFPAGLAVPNMSLPFYSNQIWYYTGGPHGAWEVEGAQAAIDFAPASTEPGCALSEHWVTAVSEGLVVRSERGILVVDLDGDGYEETGWVIMYLHVSNSDHIRVGQWVNRGDKLGNPSCEGGVATGTHVHIARKYNGEWIAAGGPMPLVFSGWTAQSGTKPYEGTLTREDQIVTACTCSNVAARIAKSPDDPY